jgi:hypothetical protein
MMDQSARMAQSNHRLQHYFTVVPFSGLSTVEGLHTEPADSLMQLADPSDLDLEETCYTYIIKIPESVLSTLDHSVQHCKWF